MKLFRDATIGQWPRIIRFTRLAEEWSPELANQLISWMDRRLSQDTTDGFLKKFRLKFNAGKADCKNLQIILGNLMKNPWINQKLSDLVSMSEERYATEADVIWQMFQDEKLIQNELNKMSKTDMEAEEILGIMNRDPDCKSIIGDKQKQQHLLRQINAVKSNIAGVLVCIDIVLFSIKFFI